MSVDHKLQSHDIHEENSLHYSLIHLCDFTVFLGHELSVLWGCLDIVMTRPVVTTCLTTLNVMRERRELDGVSQWIVLPTYTLFLFVYVYA